MKKWLSLALGIASACAIAAAIIVALRKCGGCPGKRFRALFTEKDFTVLPMEDREKV
ncbi:MAG: hypothetical protein Q4C00_02540 [Bacillota bacterium]|nr:hypothetical protein [Bacillota bacterium]